MKSYNSSHFHGVFCVRESRQAMQTKGTKRNSIVMFPPEEADMLSEEGNPLFKDGKLSLRHSATHSGHTCDAKLFEAIRNYREAAKPPPGGPFRNLSTADRVLSECIAKAKQALSITQAVG